MTRPRTACAALFVCACSLSATTASAATSIIKTSNTDNQTFERSTDPHLLDLGEGHGTALTLAAAVPARLLIYFNAECSVASTTHFDGLRVEILVDGLVTPPTGPSIMFCTADGDGTLDNWVTAAADASVDVGAGTHTIELRGHMIGVGVVGDDWWIGDLSLIVITSEL